jgi:hypothetical protein
MNVKPAVKVVFCLAALFLLGSVCGFAVSGRVVAARGPAETGSAAPRLIERWLDHRMANDFAAIQAAPEQQEQLRPSYETLRADLAAIRQEAAQKVAEAIRRQRMEMVTKLTPEQRQAFRQSIQERSARFWELRRETPQD